MVSRLHNPCGGHLALDFVNSIGRSPGRIGRERLTDYPALLRWSREAGSLPADEAEELDAAAEARPAEAARALARARELREALFALFHGEVTGAPPAEDALRTLNRALGEALRHTEVARGPEGWRLALVGGGALERPLWPLARAGAELLVAKERPPVKVCDSETCLWLFLDRSRNRRRRWCEMEGCGNRAKVRRHRRRRRADRAGGDPPAAPGR